MNGWGGSVGKIIASLRSVGIGGDTLKENSQYRDVVTDVSTGHITNGSLSQLIRRRSTITLRIQGNFTRLNGIHDVPETITCDKDELVIRLDFEMIDVRLGNQSVRLQIFTTEGTRIVQLLRMFATSLTNQEIATTNVSFVTMQPHQASTVLLNAAQLVRHVGLVIHG